MSRPALISGSGCSDRSAVPARLPGMNGFQELDGERDEPLHVFVDTNEWCPVSSSWIDEARYDRASSELWLRIHGRDYSYPGVTPEEALRFWDAPSKGRWVWGNYPPPQRG